MAPSIDGPLNIARSRTALGAALPRLTALATLNLRMNTFGSAAGADVMRAVRFFFFITLEPEVE